MMELWGGRHLSRGETIAYGPIPEYNGIGYPTGERRTHCSLQIDLRDDAAERLVTFSNLIRGDLLAEKGIEVHPHVTALYGLDEIDNDTLSEFFQNQSPIDMTFGATSLFVVPDKYDVLKCDVASPGLRALNARIAATFPHEDTQPSYRPHATIAYLRPGMGATLTGKSPLAGIRYVADCISFCNYSGDRSVFKFMGTPESNDDAKELETPSLLEMMQTSPGKTVMSAGGMSFVEKARQFKAKVNDDGSLKWSKGDDGHHYARGVNHKYAIGQSGGKFNLHTRDNMHGNVELHSQHKNSTDAIAAANEHHKKYTMKGMPQSEVEHNYNKVNKMSASESPTLIQSVMQMSAAGGMPDVGGAAMMMSLHGKDRETDIGPELHGHLTGKIHEAQNRRDWSKLPADYHKDAVKKLKEYLQPHFRGQANNHIRARAKLSKATDFPHFHEAVSMLRGSKAHLS